MPRTRQITIGPIVVAVFAGFSLWAGLISSGAAQFRLPKIPSLPKTSKPGSPEVKPSRAGTREVVSSVSPDSAPPGGHGQVVLTGQNFKDGMQIQFQCKGADFSADSVKFDSPTKVEAQITVPVTAQEGPCGIGGNSTPGKEPFRISNSANMPIALTVAFLGEGDMQFMDIMMKMQQSAMAQGPGNQSKGEIQLGAGSIKYVQGGKETFTESISGVKSMGEMKQNGQPIGIFRIVFNDGKIYNFGAMGNTAQAHSTFEFLQKKLGK